MGVEENRINPLIISQDIFIFSFECHVQAMLIYLTCLWSINTVYESSDILDSLDAPCLQQSHQKSARHLDSVQCQVNADFLDHLGY